MNEWSIRRKRVIFLIAVLILAIVLGVPLFFFFHQAPSCTDGKQDGDETGIDCGGSCALLCPADSLPMINNGDPQVLKVASSTYDVVAYVQNPNVSGKVLDAAYTFDLYGASSTIPLKTIQGTTFIPKNSSFAIFEGPISFVEETPVRATFAWSGGLQWQKDTAPVPLLQVKDIVLSNANTSPRINAQLENDSLGSVSNIELGALIFDQNGNIIAASKTVVDSIDAGQSAPLVFTWPTAFSSATTSIEILPRIFPDNSFIK
jgi:hypothetical protein